MAAHEYWNSARFLQILEIVFAKIVVCLLLEGFGIDQEIAV